VQFEVETGGRVRHVAVSRTGDSFAVSVDGRLHQVDFARVDAHTLSLIVDTDLSAGPQDAALGGSTNAGPDKARPTSGNEARPAYEATIVPDSDGRLVVLIGAVPVALRLNGRRGGSRRQGGAARGAGPLKISAPMPGKVVRILVKAGDTVRARQAVVVVEAMKMENELRADRDGTVAEIHTREGMSVEAGALLVVIQ
jgi:biotin carboxyl carrier protein